MLRRLREMYRRSRLDREPDEIIVKDVVLRDWNSDCIWDYIDPSEMYCNQPLWWRFKTRIRYLPMDILVRFEIASDDVAEYERGRWGDDRPSRWTYFLSFLYRKVIRPYYFRRMMRRGMLGRMRKRWRLFLGKEKLVETRIRLVNE